jgi:hemin uptake protein HemP
MKPEDKAESAQKTDSAGQVLHGAHLRTLEALFRHPTAHNLEWQDVITLFERIGSVHRRGGDKFSLEVAGEHLLIHKPHTKDLTSSEVVDVRNLLRNAGWTPQSSRAVESQSGLGADVLMVVVDHHGAKIYRITPAASATDAIKIAPYDPHHFLHHLAHKDQTRAEGQRAPEDSSFYARISEALAAASKVVVVGHGQGKSNAAQHLVEYLRTHHPETYERVVRELEADLSAVTLPQLAALAGETFGWVR